MGLNRFANGRRTLREQLAVRMAGRGEDLLCRTDFNDRAGIEYGNAITYGLDHGQIVTDENIGESQFSLQIGQQIEHLGLNGNIQGGNGFIEHQNASIRCQRLPDSLLTSSGLPAAIPD